MTSHHRHEKWLPRGWQTTFGCENLSWFVRLLRLKVIIVARLFSRRHRHHHPRLPIPEAHLSRWTRRPLEMELFQIFSTADNDRNKPVCVNTRSLRAERNEKNLHFWMFKNVYKSKRRKEVRRMDFELAKSSLTVSSRARLQVSHSPRYRAWSLMKVIKKS